MCVYVISDADSDWMFTAALTESECWSRMGHAIANKRVLVHPMRRLFVKHLYGWDNDKLRQAQAEYAVPDAARQAGRDAARLSPPAADAQEGR